MATMKEIAERLGVSLGTVSKGLNGGRDISEDLRQDILNAAVELGYTSRRSKKKDQRKLAVLIANMDFETEDSFGYEIVLGFRQAAFAADWAVDVLPITRDFQEARPFDAFIKQEKWSGVFLLGFSFEDPWLNECRTTQVPAVLLDNSVNENPHVAGIGTDSDEAMDMSVTCLMELGHEKIAFLNGSAGSRISDHRMAAYLSAMHRHRLPIDPNLAVYGYYVADAAKYHVPGFLDRGATAIMCGNDLIASGVIECCRALGFSVPEDVSVIGFDDIPLAEQLAPPLTTIRQPRAALGRSGCHTLLSIIDQVPVSRTLLRPSLIVRGSVAAARPRVAKKQENDKDSVERVAPELYRIYARMPML